MKFRNTSGLLAVSLVLIAFAPVGAQTFQKIVATEVVVPGLGVTFGELDPPVLSGDELAFRAQSFVSQAGTGIFKTDLDGNFTSIATGQTANPAGGGVFTEFGEFSDLPSIHSGTVAFTARNASKRGVFTGSGVGLNAIVTTDTDFPDTDVVPLKFGSPSLHGRIAVTMSNSSHVPSFAGIYSNDLGTLFTVIDTSNATFGYFNVSLGTTATGLPNEDVFLFSVNQSPSGPHYIFRRSYDEPTFADPELIVGTNTQRPDGVTLFDTPSRAQPDRHNIDRLCFMDGAGITNGGVFRATGTAIETVADTSTPIPDGIGNFTEFGLWCAIDAGDVAFVGRGSDGQQGVYIGRWTGVLEKIIDTNGMLGGSTPSIFDLSREALYDGRLAFKAFAAGEQTIWVTTAPEPDGVCAGLAALLAMISIRRRRRRQSADVIA
jgi:hypothetical protein